MKTKTNEKAKKICTAPMFRAALFMRQDMKATYWKFVAEPQKDAGILGLLQRSKIQSGARDEAWSLRAFV